MLNGLSLKFEAVWDENEGAGAIESQKTPFFEVFGDFGRHPTVFLAIFLAEGRQTVVPYIIVLMGQCRKADGFSGVANANPRLCSFAPLPNK